MYYCNYCQNDHPDESISEEHIIPSSFGNKSYTLPKVCFYVNRIFAATFERDFAAQPFVREVLLKCLPKKTNARIDLGEVKTKSGSTEHRWLQKGKEFLANLPEYKKTNRITLQCQNANGEAVDGILELPFEVTTTANGSSLFLNEDRIISRDEAKIAGYLKKLQKNPEINPAFNAFIIRENIVPRASPIVQKRVDRASEKFEPVNDILDQIHPMNREVFSQFFFKIAWTHTCKTLGAQALNNPVGKWILRYLMGRLIPIDIVPHLECHEISCSAMVKKIADCGFYVWAGDLEASGKVLFSTSCFHPSIFERMVSLLNRRSRQIYESRGFVSCRKEMKLDGATTGSEKTQHTLSFVNETKNGKKGLICNVQLFDGIFDVDVQVSNQHIEIPENKIQKVIEIR